MKSNIGTINALIRLTLGFTVLPWVTSRMVRRPYRDSYLLIAFMAAMKIAEGITRFCPVTFLFERYQEEQEDRSANGEDITHNPS